MAEGSQGVYQGIRDYGTTTNKQIAADLKTMNQLAAKELEQRDQKRKEDRTAYEQQLKREEARKADDLNKAWARQSELNRNLELEEKRLKAAEKDLANLAKDADAQTRKDKETAVRYAKGVVDNVKAEQKNQDRKAALAEKEYTNASKETEKALTEYDKKQKAQRKKDQEEVRKTAQEQISQVRRAEGKDDKEKQYQIELKNIDYYKTLADMETKYKELLKAENDFNEEKDTKKLEELSKKIPNLQAQLASYGELIEAKASEAARIAHLKKSGNSHADFYISTGGLSYKAKSQQLQSIINDNNGAAKQWKNYKNVQKNGGEVNIVSVGNKPKQVTVTQAKQQEKQNKEVEQKKKEAASKKPEANVSAGVQAAPEIYSPTPVIPPGSGQSQTTPVTTKASEVGKSTEKIDQKRNSPFLGAAKSATEYLKGIPEKAAILKEAAKKQAEIQKADSKKKLEEVHEAKPPDTLGEAPEKIDKKAPPEPAKGQTPTKKDKVDPVSPPKRPVDIKDMKVGHYTAKEYNELDRYDYLYKVETDSVNRGLAELLKQLAPDDPRLEMYEANLFRHKAISQDLNIPKDQAVKLTVPKTKQGESIPQEKIMEPLKTFPLKPSWNPQGTQYYYTLSYAREKEYRLKHKYIDRQTMTIKETEEIHRNDVGYALEDMYNRVMKDTYSQEFKLYRDINFVNTSNQAVGVYLIPQMNYLRYMYWVNNKHMVRYMDAFGGAVKYEDITDPETIAQDDGLYVKNATIDQNHPNKIISKDPSKPIQEGKFTRMSPWLPRNSNARAATDTWNMIDGFIRANSYSKYQAYKGYNSTTYTQEYELFENLGYKIGKGTANPETQTNVLDRQWIHSRFMTPNMQLKELDRFNRFFSTAGWKHTCTRLGHHDAINPKPQFTRTCDIKGNNRHFSKVQAGTYPLISNNKDKADPKLEMDYVGFRPPGAEYTIGMGRYYSEAIDDNATKIYLQFGVPKFNSLLSFFTRAVSYVDMVIATHGRVPIGYKFGKLVGGFVMWRAFPICTGIIFLTKLVFGFFWGGPFKYYYMNPTMHTYWTCVSQLVTQLCTELGILHPWAMPDKQDENKLGLKVQMDQSELSDLQAYFPSMFSSWSNFVDIYAVATQEQKLAKVRMRMQYDKIKTLADGNMSNADINNLFTGYRVADSADLKSEAEVMAKDSGGFLKWAGVKANLESFLNFITGRKGFYFEETRTDGKPLSDGAKETDEESVDLTKEEEDQIAAKMDPQASQADKDKELDRHKEIKKALVSASEKSNAMEGDKEKGIDQAVEGVIDVTAKAGKAIWDKVVHVSNRWWNYLKQKVRNGTGNYAATFDSVIQGGGEYAVFIVDYPGSFSDSFSNSFSDIETGQGVKSIAQGARNLKFNLAGGSLGSFVDGIKDTVIDFASGVLDSVTFGFSNVLRTIMGGAYVDLPKKWDDSEFSKGSVSYSIDLVSPYGNVFSQLQNIYIPMCMLLAGVLPLRAGEASYTSPFLCTVFDKGVQDIQLGMITELSIERGITNLSYTKNKRCLSFRVTFTVTDFSTRLSAPMNASLFQAFEQNFNMSLDDNSPLDTWLATIASRDLYTAKYVKQKMKQKFSRFMMAVAQTVSVHGNAMNHAEIVKNLPIVGAVVNALGPERAMPFSQSNGFNPLAGI